MKSDQSTEQLIQLLLKRLERVSADSYWAHRASGIRGGLLRVHDTYKRGEEIPDENAKHLIASGLDILIKAAKKQS